MHEDYEAPTHIIHKYDKAQNWTTGIWNFVDGHCAGIYFNGKR